MCEKWAELLKCERQDGRDLVNKQRELGAEEKHSLSRAITLKNISFRTLIIKKNTVDIEWLLFCYCGKIL